MSVIVDTAFLVQHADSYRAASRAFLEFRNDLVQQSDLLRVPVRDFQEPLGETQRALRRTAALEIAPVRHWP